LDLSNAEGRAHLVHDAKQYLTRLAAPILRVQLTKAIAEAAAMTQAEVEAQCGLKPPMRGRPPPPMRKRPTPRSIDHALLEIVARRPEWSARVPLDLIDSDQVEGAALLAIAHATEHGEIPAGGFCLLLEFFRGSIHEPVFSALAANLAEEDDNSESLDAVFTDALDRLRAAAVGREIAALTARAKHGLSAVERQRLTQLLAQKHVSAVSSDNRSV
jgi:DNA primase